MVADLSVLLQCNKELSRHQQERTVSAWTGFVIAVGVSSLICLALTVRAERIQSRRKLSSGRPDGGSFATSDFGSYFWSRTGGDHSTGDHSACSARNDGWGGSDSGGGGDCGGGGGDGGC